MAQTRKGAIEPYLEGAAQDFKNAFWQLGVHLPQDIPYRMAKAWAEMLSGYREDWREHAKTFKLDGLDQFDGDEPLVIPFGDGENHQMVEVSCSFVSVCEHHVLPFEGTATVRYEASHGVVLGASKVVRIVRVLACRLQIQERLTQQIAEAVAEVSGTKQVEVETVATHACMRCRGVRDQNSSMRCRVNWKNETLCDSRSG